MTAQGQALTFLFNVCDFFRNGFTFLILLYFKQDIASNNFQLFIEQNKTEKGKYFSNNSLNDEETNFDGLVEENCLKEKVGITLHYW